MKRRRQPKSNVALEMAPLIDIVFQLIAFFVFSTGFQGFDQNVVPPSVQVDVRDLLADQILLIEISRDGSLKVGGDLLRWNELSSELERRATTTDSVVVRADGSLAFRQVQTALKALANAKIADVKLQVRNAL